MIPISKPIIGKREIELVNEVLNSGFLVQGPKVKALEESFAKRCGVKHAIALNNGTSALHTALYAIGIKPGDEVITTPFTFVATANSILMQNAKCVFCDIEDETFNIDPKLIEAKITKKTKAILAVDLFGHPAEYKKIIEIAKKHNLVVIEDAAQSHDAELNGIRSGALANIAGFSFYATKNMMTGEGGMVTTNDDDAAELCRRFRHHGQSEKTRYEYFDIGYNYRMTDLQAAIGIAQLESLEDFTNKRIKNAEYLNDGLKNIKGIKTPCIKKGAKHVYHQYTIIVDGFKLSRDELLDYLKKNEVGCGIYYPKPLHLHPHFSRMGYKEGNFPVSEKASKMVISLPVHPSLTISDLDKIIKVIKTAAS